MDTSASKALRELADNLGISEHKEKGIPPDFAPLSLLNDKQRALRKRKRKQAKSARKRNR